MLLSVVTVVNKNPAVAETLRSVLAQKGLDLESVVVGGAGSDAALASLKPFRRRIRLVGEADGGMYSAMNQGLRLAKGRVVGFLNAGDVFVGDRNLAAVAKAFISDPGLGACFADLEIVDAQGRAKRWWPAQPYSKPFRTGWTPSHPTFYALRQALLDLGGFDTRYRLAADFDLMMKALEVAHLRSTVVPRTLVRMQSGGAGLATWGAIWRHNREAWKAARSAGITRASFAVFLADKLGRKVPQIFRRP